MDRVVGHRPLVLDDLVQLSYTKMVLQEVLRLTPPSFAFVRQALEADEMRGFAIPKDSVVFVSPYYTHRHPDFWKDPERFDPERFTPEQEKQQHRYAYFPFGGGPHQCIGNDFAMLEAHVVLGIIAQRYRLRLPLDKKVVPEVVTTLRIKDGLPMFIQQR